MRYIGGAKNRNRGEIMSKTLSIKAARVESGYSQEALAQILGISKRTLISWENGEVEMKPLNMYAIAYVLSYSTDELRVPLKKIYT